MLSEYKWILLQNLNDGLGLIWVALLIGITGVAIHFLIDMGSSDTLFTRFRMKGLRYVGWIFLLLGGIWVALPDKEQIVLLRGEEEGCLLSDPSAGDNPVGKKGQKENPFPPMVSECVEEEGRFKTRPEA